MRYTNDDVAYIYKSIQCDTRNQSEEGAGQVEKNNQKEKFFFLLQQNKTQKTKPRSRQYRNRRFD